MSKTEKTADIREIALADIGMYRFADDVIFEETRRVRADSSSVTVKTEPSKDMLKGKNDDGTFEKFEHRPFSVKIRLKFGADNLQRLFDHTFSQLVIKAQNGKLRPKAKTLGDDGFERWLKNRNGLVEYLTATDFVPQSRAKSSVDKAAAAIADIDADDEEAIKTIEAILEAKRKAKQNAADAAKAVRGAK